MKIIIVKLYLNGRAWFGSYGLLKLTNLLLINIMGSALYFFLFLIAPRDLVEFYQKVHGFEEKEMLKWRIQ